VKIFVGFKSDLELLSACMKKAAEDVLGHAIEEKAKIYQDILKNTPVHDSQAIEKPDNTWLEVKLHYLVNPKNAGIIKTQITQKCSGRLTSIRTGYCFRKVIPARAFCKIFRK
jgi:hypothetical protein